MQTVFGLDILVVIGFFSRLTSIVGTVSKQGSSVDLKSFQVARLSDGKTRILEGVLRTFYKGIGACMIHLSWRDD